MVSPGRLDFPVSDEDVAFLDSLGLNWEAVEDNGVKAIILHRYSLPAIFNPSIVDMHVRLPDTYNTGAELDMFYTKPMVTRKDGQPIPNFTDIQFKAETWQQWSRHRDEQPWRPGEDNLATHIAFMALALKKEAGEL